MITAYGWMTLVVAAGTAGVGLVFGLVELFVIATALVVAVVGAALWAQWPMPPIGVHRRTWPAQLTAGESGRGEVVLSNLGRRRTPQLELRESVGERGRAVFQLAALAPGARTGAAYALPTARRGLLRCGPLSATRTDPLGLCRRRRTLGTSTEVLVAPRTVHLAPPTVGGAGALGQALLAAHYAHSGTEFHSVREYVPGDDPRRVSWKLSARSDTLVVTETTSEGLRRFTVVLDTCADSYRRPGGEHDDGMAFELAVSAAASLIGAASGTGLELRLVSADADFRGAGAAALAAPWLATITPQPDEPGPITGGPRGDGLGVWVIVTGSTESPAAVSARGVRDDVVVVVATMATPTGRLAVDGTSLESLRSSWEHLVTGTHTRETVTW